MKLQFSKRWLKTVLFWNLTNNAEKWSFYIFYDLSFDIKVSKYFLSKYFLLFLNFSEIL